MSKKIIGVTVGTPISPNRIAAKIKPVKTVNGEAPDENGNVEVIGNNGKDGADGKTPVKGTDYFTAADKAEMVNSVKESIEENGLVIGDETVGNGEQATRIEENYIALTMNGEGAYMASGGKGNISFYDSDTDDNVILSNIAEPDGYYDAANKGYVDSKTTDKAETWTFTLANGSTVTKKVVLG